MEKKQHKSSDEEVRKQKLMLVLPLLVIPFIMFSFWVLGGGKHKNNYLSENSTGLNMDLPVAENNKTQNDKLSLYDVAEKDLQRLNELKKADPYYSAEDLNAEYYEGYDDYQGFRSLSFQDNKEKQIYDKINQLNASLDQSQYYPTPKYSEPTYVSASETYQIKSDITRLEEMMSRMQNVEPAPDPEMEQINTVLQSVLDIQHPVRVQDRIKRTSLENLGQVFAVDAVKIETPITFLSDQIDTGISDVRSVFYGLSSDHIENNDRNTIEAVVHETSTVTSGSTLKLRLLNDIYVNGNLIPKDNFLFGKVSFQDERLAVTIDAIRYQNSIFPVKLSVVDLDGIEGICIPSSVIREVAKQGGDQFTNSIGINSFSPNIGTQLATTGIDIGRSMINKKVKAVKVQVKSGYRILLRDNKI
ncbi:conjugative transposon protein TraM [Sphingobacterium yanglingense]|uniref:Conjugative transposon TraM protein n=1 Tax=Sphingobacterium yanglingense TaxID=1437280 RepID=A0A4V3DCW4_9SPHI|nr:conjugative transposon protein TraM [Sphingobacterium yanglingense]TDQ73803.1 conjugative transposon TraM protein [Sphingobacterium yanglingense]